MSGQGFARIDYWFIDEYAAQLGPCAVTVFLCLKRHEDSEGIAYPTIARLQDKTGLSRPTVIRALKALSDCGVIEPHRELGVKGKHSQTPVYKMVKPVKDFNQLEDSPDSAIRAQTGKANEPVKNMNRLSIFTQPVKNINRSLHVTNKTQEQDPNICPIGNSGFTDFWGVFPNHENKKKAEDWWKRHKPNAELIALIMAGVEAAKKGQKWREGFVPHAITWLNGERWNDEVAPSAVHQVRQGNRGSGLTAEEMKQESLRNLRGSGFGK